MSSRLTRVLAWRWTPWIVNLSLALVARALLPADVADRGERYTYVAMSQAFPLSSCASFHCFRFLAPLFTALAPGTTVDAFIVTTFVFQVLAGVALWHLAAHVSESPRIAWLTTAWYWVTWAPILSLSDPLLITDPVQAFWCFASLFLLLTGRHGLALAMLVSGAAVKESVLLIPCVYALYVIMTAPRAALHTARLARMAAMIAAPALAWLGVRAVLHAYHGYAIASDASYLRRTYFFGVWLKGLAPWPLNLRFAALYIFGTFGAGWILGALGLTRANRHERAIAAASVPAMLFLALYQVPDRALASFPYAVLIPAARYMSAWPTPLAVLLLIVNAALTIRLNTAPGWLPSSTIVLAALGAIVAVGIWTTRRISAPAGDLDGARPDWRGAVDVTRLSLAALGIAIGLVVVFLWRSAHVPPVMRLSLQDGVAVVDDDAGTPGLALSPDERALVFVGSDRSGVHRLWRLRFGETIATVLNGTDGATAPFWAPDGRRLGFFADGTLKTIEVDTARAQVVADAPTPRGGAWGADDVIVFAPSEHDGLYKVSAPGGTPAPITSLDAAAGQRSHRWPSFLPDRKRFLFTAWEATGAPSVYLGSLSSAPPMRLGGGVNHPTYAGGFVVHPREDSLFAQLFDLRRQQLLGSPRVARDSFAYAPESGRGAFTVGEHTLVYASTTAQWQLALAPASAVGQWLDLTGRPAPIQVEAPAIGRRVPAGTPPSTALESELSPDGRWVAYTSFVSGKPQIFVQANPSNGPAWPISDEGGLHPRWRADGRALFFVIGDRFLAAADIETAPGFHSSAPRRLFAVDFPSGDSTHGASDFALSADGQRVFVRAVLGQHPSAPVFIVQQWRNRLAPP
ncbi:MAG: hypothetical protein LAO77_10675 [Acidobacteriia bacterium]|nr:hypothetical protein [Terriglobia bacterium]